MSIENDREGLEALGDIRTSIGQLEVYLRDRLPSDSGKGKEPAPSTNVDAIDTSSGDDSV